MTDTDDLADRIEQLEKTIAEARGTIKAGVVFMAILNTLFLPIIVWMLTSTVTTRELTMVHSVKIEKLEASLAGR